jgi:hypothetical protein
VIAPHHGDQTEEFRIIDLFLNAHDVIGMAQLEDEILAPDRKNPKAASGPLGRSLHRPD